jgi:hypothetical protein
LGESRLVISPPAEAYRGRLLPSSFLAATLTGNGIANASFLAFDGVFSPPASEAAASPFWRAADRSPQGSFPAGSGSLPYGVASDGVNFGVVLSGTGQLARF